MSATPTPLPLPPGGDQDISAQYLAPVLVLTIIGLAIVGLRLYVRSYVLRALWWDDFFIVVAMVFALVGTGLCIGMVHLGIGHHVQYLPLDNILEVIKLLTFSIMFANLSTTAARISVCLFLLKIFSKDRRWKQALLALAIFIGIINTAMILPLWFECRPVTKIWYIYEDGECWSPQTKVQLAVAQGGIVAAFDFILAALPVAALWKIRMSAKTKAAICGLMGLGIFTGIAAILRTVNYNQLVDVDITYDIIIELIWGGVEIFLSIAAACIPALRPLLTKRARTSTKEYADKRRAQAGYRLRSNYERRPVRHAGSKELSFPTILHGEEDDIPLQLENQMAKDQDVLPANSIHTTTTIEVESVAANDGLDRGPHYLVKKA